MGRPTPAGALVSVSAGAPREWGLVTESTTAASSVRPETTGG